MGLLYQDESYEIRGACLEVYKEKGSGFTEPICHECLIAEFDLRSLPAVSEPHVQVFYKGKPLQKSLKPDFVCHSKIIVEIKAVKKLTDEHRAQLLNYLKATGFKLGFLVNFCSHPSIEIERMVLEKSRLPKDQDPPHLQ